MVADQTAGTSRSAISIIVGVCGVVLFVMLSEV